MKKTAVFIILILVTFFISCGTGSNEKVKYEKSNEVVGDKSEENGELEKIKEEESKEEESKKEEVINEVEKGEEVVEGKAKYYLDKYIKLEKELKDSLAVKYSGTTIEMKEAAGIENKNWDDLLNEIYGVLQEQLAEEKMNEVKAEQIKWITIRDSKAEEATNEVKGGTMEPLVYVSTLGETTKERCYELIMNYMK